MAFNKNRVTESFQKFLTKRKNRKTDHADSQAAEPRESIVLDAITVESILSLRGRNPFPEEEGEIGFMNSSLRERSLL
jgi:hypothetical protein